MRNKYEVQGEITIIFLRSSIHGIFETKIDTDDLVKVKKAKAWWVLYNPTSKSFYVEGDLENKRNVKLHRYVMGVTKKHNLIDHIFHDTLDNRKSQLRVVTPLENCQNRKMRPDNTSGHKGVHWNKRQKKWTAYISYNGKRMHLGNFENKEEAVKSRKESEKKYHKYKYGISKEKVRC